jgi:hypothetical protein
MSVNGRKISIKSQHTFIQDKHLKIYAQQQQQPVPTNLQPHPGGQRMKKASSRTARNATLSLNPWSILSHSKPSFSFHDALDTTRTDRCSLAGTALGPTTTGQSIPYFCRLLDHFLQKLITWIKIIMLRLDNVLN